MRFAYNEALKAWEKGEIPVGAVAVIDEKLVARADNAVETNHDPTAHAEMQLIRELSQKKRRLATDRCNALRHQRAVPDVRRCDL